MTTMPRRPAYATLLSGALLCIVTAGCARPPQRLSGELAARAESLMAAADGRKLVCAGWVTAGEVGKVRGCHVSRPDGVQRFFYVDTAGRVLSVGTSRGVSSEQVYAAVGHSQMEFSHQYGLPGECREGSLRALFWHAPTHHAIVLSELEPAADRARSSVSVVLIDGPLSCGASVLYRDPSGVAS